MLILASNSPRRKELLALSGLPFRVQVPDVDESFLHGESAEAYVCRISESKAHTAFLLHGTNNARERYIVACDTVVVDNNQVIGKPADAEGAAEILMRLRGRVHKAYSSLTVIDTADGSVNQELCITDVMMRNYSEEEMWAYISSGDPMDKAGAYAIQHAGFHPVAELSGCYANVMGLPLCHLQRTLSDLAFTPDADIPQTCQEHIGYDCPVFKRILDREV